MNLPNWSGLARLLAGFSGARAYLIPITSADGQRALGNNGDRLMHDVFLRLLGVLNISLTEDTRSADLVIVPPSGALLEVYHFPDILARRLKPFTSIPMVIFPSSALFPGRDPAFMFQGRTASTLWILREQYSAEHLHGQWGSSLAAAGVVTEVDHDVVASGHEFVREIVGAPSAGGGLLVAARLDRECSDLRSAEAGGASKAHNLVRNSVKKLIPYGRIYTGAARFARRKVLAAAGSDLLHSILESEITTHESAGVIRRVDLSATPYATYAEYLAVLRRSDGVVTNRLHVGLPSAILGKKVVLVEAGYHKLQGVYEQSLRQMANVTLIGAS